MENQEIALILLVSITFVTVSTILILYTKVFKNMKKPTISKEKNSINFESIVCHKCKKDMEKGYILASRGIHFVGKNENVGIFSVTYSKVLQNTVNMGVKMKYLKAWRCDTCKTVTFDYSETYKN